MTKKVVVGRFGRAHGLNGWLKVISFTLPQENILNFSPWLINVREEWRELCIENSRIVGNGVLVKIEGVDNCDLARSYTNLTVSVERNQLPVLADKQYYWSDLEGLRVINTSSKELGVVDHVLATGANDVLVVKRAKKELLIPYIKNVILKVDLESKMIKVDYEF